MSLDLDDLLRLNVCEKCRHVFMPTEEQQESYLRTKYCAGCEDE